MKIITTAPILPGAWLGILGGGQLGRLFCLAAHSMGYHVAVLAPDQLSPAGAIADRHLCAAYDDKTALNELMQLCAACSIEFENVSADSLNYLAQKIVVSPAGHCVAIMQNRITEKRFIADAGLPVAPYLAIESAEALAMINEQQLTPLLPGILKTAQLGYDGKGQTNINNAAELQRAYTAFGKVACVLEKHLPIAYEVSVLIARGADGATAIYPLAQNRHRNAILIRTIAPAPDASAALIRAAAQHAALTLADRMHYVGVLCVEFFVLQDGLLIVNEMAPRPHNSGHYTIDACATSQFEQQVRVMTGLPLGDPRQHSPAVMLNLLGDLWWTNSVYKTPPWDKITALPSARLHLYAKAEARTARKMGHLTLAAATLDEARAAAKISTDLLKIKIDK